MKGEMWAKVAEELQVPWRAAESMHWALGETEMARRAGVIPFSMAPQASTTATSSTSTSASGLEPAGYAPDPRVPSGLRESSFFEPEEGDEYEGSEEEGRGTRGAGPGGQGVMLPSLAELTGGVPAYAGFVGAPSSPRAGDAREGAETEEERPEVIVKEEERSKRL